MSWSDFPRANLVPCFYIMHHELNVDCTHDLVTTKARGDLSYRLYALEVYSIETNMLLDCVGPMELFPFLWPTLYVRPTNKTQNPNFPFVMNGLHDFTRKSK